MIGEVTFLLGAGFSKPFGGPLVSDLHDIVSEKPSKHFDPLRFELKDFVSMVEDYNYDIMSEGKLRYNVFDLIDFYNGYRSFLVSEYLNVYNFLPSYELVLGQMGKDIQIFDSSSNLDYTNHSRKNKITELGDFIKSDVPINEKYHNLILHCIDLLTLLVFDRIQENIDIKKIPNPLLTEYIKKINRATILSLNYDKVVEDILTHNNIEYTDGFESYKWNISENPIYRFSADSFDNAKVNVFKLHGSIDYGVVGKDTIGGFINTTTVKFNTEDVKALKADFKRKDGYRFYAREFIIGSYNKAEKYFRRTFIDLFNIGISKLNDSDALIVIGYSFQDDPINLIISNWLKKSKKKKMIVINGEFNGTEIPARSGSAVFRSHLKEQVINTQRYLENITVDELEGIINREIING